jgi:hypothetical protein
MHTRWSLAALAFCRCIYKFFFTFISKKKSYKSARQQNIGMGPGWADTEHVLLLSPSLSSSINVGGSMCSHVE